jgi:hypothetical protein
MKERTRSKEQRQSPSLKPYTLTDQRHPESWTPPPPEAKQRGYRSGGYWQWRLETIINIRLQTWSARPYLSLFVGALLIKHPTTFE